MDNQEEIEKVLAEMEAVVDRLLEVAKYPGIPSQEEIGRMAEPKKNTNGEFYYALISPRQQTAPEIIKRLSDVAFWKLVLPRIRNN
jgi:hypothetical protein